MKTSNAMTRRLRNNQGFTLIEMAIVLVIIGIIIGAVVKGQDLVDNAKSKQFASKLQAWQVSLNTYYDRKGRFPGDDNRNGIIASGDTLTPLDDISSAKFESAPEDSFVIGGATFKVSLGNDGAAVPKNYLVVTKAVPASAYVQTNTSDTVSLKFFEAFDTSIDGSANPAVGSVKGFTAANVATGAKLTALTATANTDWLADDTTLALGLQLK